MARKCQICGDLMVYKVGEHYRHTEKGMVLYRGVRQYTCPRGCRGAYFDFKDAHPVDQPVRMLGFIPAPRKTVNVIDPLLYGGLGFGYLLFVVGTLLMGINPIIKGVAIVLLTFFALLLAKFMRSSAPESSNEGI